jgi:Cft2 family RNA processing exonuclease
MDAPRQVDLSFISHAHLAQPLFHSKILVTHTTAQLGKDFLACKPLICPFYRKFALGDLELELHPSGHLPGAAQLRVTSGRRQLVYTGHFNLLKRRTCESAQILTCEVLILDSTYGLPHLLHPEPKQVEDKMIAWIQQAMAQRKQPVLLCQSLGMAQELIALFNEHRIPVRAHRIIYEHCKTFRQLGIDLDVKGLRHPPEGHEVILFPRRLHHSKSLKRISNAAVVLISGQPKGSLGQEVTFALSSLSDHRGLLRYADESKAKKIYVFGAHATSLAEELRSLGHTAWSVQPPTQLDFMLNHSQKVF